MEHLISRILLLMDTYKLKNKDLAAIMKISASAFSQIILGKTTPASQSLANLIVHYPEINLNWLLTGSGEMLMSNDTEFSLLPVVGDIAAGAPMEIVATDHVNFLPIAGSTQGYTCFRINGDSMAPLILHEDLIIVKEEYDYSNLDGQIAAIQINGENTLKQIILDHSSRHLILMPLNYRKHSPIIFDPDSPDNIILLGVMKRLIRNM